MSLKNYFKYFINIFFVSTVITLMTVLKGPKFLAQFILFKNVTTTLVVKLTIKRLWMEFRQKF
jgi:hypothetical protein